MSVMPPRPTLFLDCDDVLCPNAPYGGLHAQLALARPDDAPPDIFERLFSPESVDVLNELIDEFSPRVVLTTSWLAFLDRPHFIEMFSRCRLEGVAANFHKRWDVPTDRGASRLQAIENWLERHHLGEPILVLDDIQSGESLVGSFLQASGRAVLCGATGCLQRAHLAEARSALLRPYLHSEPWR
ncbi:hypothetical protein G8A07_06910 [Roseateles sp. DAIF2]|uniref:HAD domain-containing protein n=1 Tax=Roseateles sp. DAIF2 TaxID=2714952 RepID=UPI0018A24D93|nr:HAD domain-containing protein [Roseateles sp. DAIF2]QPF72683.1 hypothetical protein G8A07_06910 [Roseateles sp. DAIF2]